MDPLQINPVGAHAVSSHRLYAVSRVSGVLATFWAVLFAVWIILGAATKPLNSAAWRPLGDFVGSQAIIGYILLTGGVLGVLGLALRIRTLSIISCLICLGWCMWIAAFGWWSNFHNHPNLASWFALLASGVFILRFWLLLVVPEPEEIHGKGW